MDQLFALIDTIFEWFTPISNMAWEFPTNFAWYAKIPILGQLSFAVLLLFGVGIYLTIATRFVQFTSIPKIVKMMLRAQPSKIGISAIASFLFGLAMRAGPGNIVGITGAISVGGPGALFWMWVVAFFGMSTAFTESVLAQLFKEKKQNEFIGGLPFYGRRLLGNKNFFGFILSLAFIIYALANVPFQTFYVFTGISTIAETVGGLPTDKHSTLYYSIAVVLVISCAFIILGGIRRVIAYTDYLVPIKAVLFCLISIVIVLINWPLLPYFFKEVFVGAFSPHAIFGGTFGIAFSQGVKRGLMSNEAGQGTITMAAAVADNDHPCEQGLVQSLGVFFDTMVICTLTGFIVVMAHVWTGALDGQAWESVKVAKFVIYLASVQALVPNSIAMFFKIIMGACFTLFAFTTLLGMISFAEISANFISKKPPFILLIRILGSLVFVPFGALTLLSGRELGSLWVITDLTNILMVYLNIPLLIIGAPLVCKVLNHYRQTNGKIFISKKILGVDTDCWTEKQLRQKTKK